MPTVGRRSPTGTAPGVDRRPRAHRFIVEAIVQLVPLPSLVPNSTPIVHLIYLAIAMRSVYGQGWIASGPKAFLGLFSFSLMLTAWLVSTSLVAPLLA